MSQRSKQQPEEEYHGPRNAKEGFYEVLIEKLHLTKKKMDLILIVLAALFVLFFVFGALKGNGIL